MIKNIRSASAGIAALAVILGAGVASSAAASAQPLPCMWPLVPVVEGGVWACQPGPPMHHDQRERELHHSHR